MACMRYVHMGNIPFESHDVARLATLSFVKNKRLQVHGGGLQTDFFDKYTCRYEHYFIS